MFGRVWAEAQTLLILRLLCDKKNAWQSGLTLFKNIFALLFETSCLKWLEKFTERKIFFWFCDLHETLIYVSKFSMEACSPMSYELVVQRKEGHNLIYHVPKRPKFLKKSDFWYLKDILLKQTWNKNLTILGFVETNGSMGAKLPKKVCKILLQILNPVTITEILAPELVIKVKWWCKNLLTHYLY